MLRCGTKEGLKDEVGSRSLSLGGRRRWDALEGLRKRRVGVAGRSTSFEEGRGGREGGLLSFELSSVSSREGGEGSLLRSVYIDLVGEGWMSGIPWCWCSRNKKRRWSLVGG